MSLTTESTVQVEGKFEDRCKALAERFGRLGNPDNYDVGAYGYTLDALDDLSLSEADNLDRECLVENIPELVSMYYLQGRLSYPDVRSALDLCLECCSSINLDYFYSYKNCFNGLRAEVMRYVTDIQAHSMFDPAAGEVDDLEGVINQRFSDLENRITAHCELRTIEDQIAAARDHRIGRGLMIGGVGAAALGVGATLTALGFFSEKEDVTSRSDIDIRIRTLFSQWDLSEFEVHKPGQPWTISIKGSGTGEKFCVAKLQENADVCNGDRVLTFLGKGGKVTFTVIPFGIDNSGFSDMLGVTRIELTKNDLLDGALRPISIQGTLEKIEFSITQKAQEDAADSALLSSGDRFRKKESKDSFGNHIVLEQAGIPGVQMSTCISVFPRAIGSKLQNSPLQAAPFDLSQLGLARLEDLVYAYPPVEYRSDRTVEYTYNITTNLTPEKLQEIGEDKLEQIKAGSAAIEEDFGFSICTEIRTLNIVDGSEANACFHRDFPWTTHFTDEWLQKNNGYYTAIHEGTHLFDIRYGISSREFKTQHSNIAKAMPKFFAQLDEGSFFKDIGEKGGHSQDNEREFLASFISSFYHPDWENRITSQSSDFRTVYLDSLNVLKRELSRNEGIPKTAPLLSDIDTMICFLTANP